MSPLLAWGDFHSRSRFARSTIPEENGGLLVVYALLTDFFSGNGHGSDGLVRSNRKPVVSFQSRFDKSRFDTNSRSEIAQNVLFTSSIII